MEKKVYEKPVATRVKGNSLVFKLIEKHPHYYACRQCSSCHNCR